MAHIDETQAKHWQTIAMKLRQASDLLSECQLTLMLHLNVTEGPANDRLNAVEHELNGLSYLFTPQSEWTGGESFKIRPPHVLSSPRLP